MQTMPLVDNFAFNLRAEMKRAGITGAELAERAGLHYVTISRILNGKISPSLDTCENIARAIGMRADTAFLEPSRKS
jgi:transcriptional regulator with XRE-family HTH domain